MIWNRIKPVHVMPVAIAIAAAYLWWTGELGDPNRTILLILGIISMVMLFKDRNYITLDEAESTALKEAGRRRVELRWIPTGPLHNMGGKLQEMDNGTTREPWRYVCGIRMLSDPEREFVCYISAYGMILGFDECEKGFNMKDYPDVWEPKVKKDDGKDKDIS